MMEHTTDRLFWTLTSVIVGALLLTLGTKAFPNATQNTLQTFSGMTKQADTATTTASDVANKILDETNSTTNTSNNSDPDAQAKANALDIYVRNPMGGGMPSDADGNHYMIQDNGDGTATLNRVFIEKGKSTDTYTFPEYIKYKSPVDDESKLLKLTSLNGSSNFIIQGDTTNIKTVVVPKTIESIDTSAFSTPNTHNGFANSNVTIKIPTATQIPDVNQYWNVPQGVDQVWYTYNNWFQYSYPNDPGYATPGIQVTTGYNSNLPLPSLNIIRY